jgi:hypothetical protein
MMSPKFRRAIVLIALSALLLGTLLGAVVPALSG